MALRLLVTIVLVASNIHAFNMPFHATGGTGRRPAAISPALRIPLRSGTAGTAAAASLYTAVVSGKVVPSKASKEADGFKWLAREFDELSVRQLYAALELRQRVFVLEQKCKRAEGIE